MTMFEAINSLLFEKGGIILCDAVPLIYCSCNILMCVFIVYFFITWCLIIFNNYTVNPSSKIPFYAHNTDSFRFLIVGGKKSGKSSTIESLAGHERTKYFSTCPHLKYVRNDNAYGRKIFAVICGNVETDILKELDDIQKFSKSLKKTVMFLDNFHVIMYCLPFHKALSQESMEYIQVLKSVLGLSIFHRHVVFVFTHGDVFEDTKYEKGYTNFEDWLNELEPNVLKDALMTCKMRCILVHNKTENLERKREQADNLFSMCRQIVLDSACLKTRRFDEKEPEKQSNSDKLLQKRARISRPILNPNDIQRCVENIADVMSYEAVENFTSLDVCINDLLNLHQLGVESRNEIGELLNKWGITEKLMWLFEISYGITDVEPEAHATYVDTLKVCLKFTESSPAFAEKLASYGVVEFLTKSLNSASLSSEKTSPDILTSYICILLNIAIQCDKNKALFAKARTQQALKKFVSHEMDDIKLASLVALCHIFSDQETQHFKLHGEDVARISTEWLKEVICDKKKRRDNNLQTWTIISALTKLAANDQMSQKIKETELIDCVSHILIESVNNNELTACREFLRASNSKNDETRSMGLERKNKLEEVSPKQSALIDSTAVQPTFMTTSRDKDVPCLQQLREIDLLLIGKIGTGKSAVGNTIIGRKAFKSCSSFYRVTTDILYYTVTFENCIIKVVDGPGEYLFTDCFEKSIQEALILCLDGYHAFLLVIKYGTIFTKEYHKFLKKYKKIFGDDFVKNYCILLMTCGDKYKEEHETLPFNEWCKEQSGYFQELLKECNYKVVLFDNMSTDENVKHQQIKELLKVLDSMPLPDQRYTYAKFQEVPVVRTKLFLDSRETMISNTTLLKVDFIMQQLDKLHTDDKESQLIKLASLNQLAQTLHLHILDLDKGTGVLKHCIQATKNLVKKIADRFLLVDIYFAERLEFYQHVKAVEGVINFPGKSLEKVTLEKMELEENLLDLEKSQREEHKTLESEIAELEKK